MRGEAAALQSVEGWVTVRELSRDFDNSIFHSKGLEDIPAAVLREFQPRELLDEVRLHVVGEAAHPALIGLVRQRHARKLVHQRTSTTLRT